MQIQVILLVGNVLYQLNHLSTLISFLSKWEYYFILISYVYELCHFNSSTLHD